jgi:hypothetical protein
MGLAVEYGLGEAAGATVVVQVGVVDGVAAGDGVDEAGAGAGLRPAMGRAGG